MPLCVPGRVSEDLRHGYIQVVSLPFGYISRRS